MKKKQQLPAVATPHLTIEDRTLFFTRVDDEWWIAIKPICEALEVKYEHQFEKLKGDPIIGQLFRIHGMVAADGRTRKMVCLPERFIYGWLFQLRSKNAKLIEFQRTCYVALFDHFHGPAKGMQDYARQLAGLQAEERKLLKEAGQLPVLKALEDNRKKQNKLRKSYAGTVSAAVSEQLKMMFLEE